ncbi:MAG: tripartite tricarboxylate transporter TctB family protein [Hyphomicrobiaceae bacterium]|nr:MAG: tripartite tricarboxylate transporter TctB family protein [Hyphomicrobiaceae bacterium]
MGLATCSLRGRPCDLASCEMQFILRLGRAAPFLMVAAVGLFLYYVAGQFDFPARPGRAGPDLWPKIVLGLMLFAAAWGTLQALLTPGDPAEISLLVRAAARAVGKAEEAQQDLDAESLPTDQRQPLRALAAILAMLAFVGSIAFVGFTIATFALMLSIMLLAGYRRPLSAALISLVGTICFFLVFQRVAYISLPLGVGPFKEFSQALMALAGVR